MFRVYLSIENLTCFNQKCTSINNSYTSKIHKFVKNAEG